MAKADVVSAAKSAFVSAQDGALQSYGESCYDGGATDQKSSDGSFQQSDIDAAVKAATDPLNAQLVSLQSQDDADKATATAAQSQVAALQAQSSDLQSKLDAMSTAKDADDKAISGLQSSLTSIQAAVDALKAIILPPPPPAS